VVPAPGSCVQAQVQLFVLGILNIVSPSRCFQTHVLLSVVRLT
jgi:hypothetical protein